MECVSGLGHAYWQKLEGLHAESKQGGFCHVNSTSLLRLLACKDGDNKNLEFTANYVV